MGVKSKFQMQHVATYIISLNYIMFLLHLLSFTSLATREVYNLKRSIQFNYNPHSVIITILQLESFHLLNWKVFHLKCISLIKLTSTLNTLFLLEWNFFHWEKG